MNDVPTKGTPPYLFIDVDGVLNSRASAVAHGGPGNPHNPTKLDTVAVSLLQRAVEELGMDVVVSSSWRGGGPAQFAAWMASYGWYNCPVVGETRPQNYDLSGQDYGSRDPRGRLIKDWLESFAPEALEEEDYLIIDDNRDAGEGHPDHCFSRTDFQEGFRYADYTRCVRQYKHRNVISRS